MKLFDFNIHFPDRTLSDPDEMIRSEMSADATTLADRISRELRNPDPALVGCNAMLLNPALLHDSVGISLIRETLAESVEQATLSVLLDFKASDLKKTLTEAKLAGLSGVKFHSYIQQIEESDFDAATAAAVIAAELGLFICIDTSYGSLDMYRLDNLKLAARIIREVKSVPVILLHHGGARLFEAMLLALAQENVWLETSFSLSYYLGSSLERDLSFVMRKLNFEQILYGSDAPYVSSQQSLVDFQLFAENWNLNPQELSHLQYDNANRLLSSLIGQ